MALPLPNSQPYYHTPIKADPISNFTTYIYTMIYQFILSHLYSFEGWQIYIYEPANGSMLAACFAPFKVFELIQN